MKQIIFAAISIFLFSCNTANKETKSPESTAATPNRLIGTWRMLQGTIVEKGDTTVTDYTKNVSFIKIINETHFAFLLHDLKKGKDSTASFVAGGGTYSLKNTAYTEHLEYCSAREWEGNDFHFKITINGDTLTQYGEEKVAGTNINRLNTEKYVRIKAATTNGLN